MKKLLLILIIAMSNFALIGQPYEATLLKDICPNETTWDASSLPSAFNKAGNRIFFFAYDLGILGGSQHIFVTDGTEEGTVQAASDGFTIGSGVFTHGNNIITLSSALGTDLMYYDGTPGNESIIMSNLTSTFTAPLSKNISFEINGKCFFWAGTSNNDYGIELYGTDGTAEGTTLLKDFNPDGDGYPGSVYPVSFVAGAYAYFVANDGTNAGLYKTDGTTDGTTLISTLSTPSVFSFYPELVNGRIIFFSVTNMWSLNPDDDELISLDTGVFPYLQTWKVNDKLVVAVQHGAQHDIISTDGLTISTIIEQGSVQTITYHTKQKAVNGYVYLLRDNNSLWKTDGTSLEQVADTLPVLTQRWFLAIEDKLFLYNGSSFFNEEESDKLYEINLETFERTLAFDFHATPPSGVPFYDEENGRFYFAWEDETAYTEPHYMDMGISNVNVEYVDLSDEELMVYPNPASDNIYIEFDGQYHADIYSLDGKLVFQSDVLTNNQRLQLPSLQQGMYVLNVRNDKKTICRKIMVN